MPKIQIEGLGLIELDDSFNTLTPEMQQQTIDEIHASRGKQPAPIPQMPAAPVMSSPEQQHSVEQDPGFTMNTAGVVMDRGLQGLASLAELPYDAVNNISRIPNLLPGEQGFKRLGDYAGEAMGVGPLPTDPYQDFARQIGVTGNFEPQGQTDRYAGAIAEEVAPALTGVGIAGKLGKAEAAGNAFQKFLHNTFVAPVKTAPKLTAATETSSAATSALAGQGVEESARARGEEANPIAKMMAQILGGVAGSMSPPSVDNFIRDRQNRTTDRLSRLDAGETLMGSAQDPQNLLSGEFKTPAVPGVKYSTGQATGDTGLLGMEYGRQSADNTGRFKARETENTSAMGNLFDSMAPKVENDLATRRVLTDRKNLALGTAEKNVHSRVKGRDDALSVIEPEMSRQEAGRVIRSKAESTREGLVRQRDDAALPLLDEALNSGAVVDIAPVAQSVKSKISDTKQSVVENALGRVKKVLNKKQQGDPVIVDGEPVVPEPELDDTISGLYESRKEINNLIAGKGQDSSSRFAKSELMDIRNQLDDALEQASPEFAQYMEKYRSGSAPINALDDSAVGKILKKTDKNQKYDIADSDVAAQFWHRRAGAPESFDDYKRTFGNDKDAMSALKSAVTDDLISKAVSPDGTVNLKSFEKWISTNKDKLDQMGSLGQELSSVISAQRLLNNAQRRQKLLKEGLNNPRTSTIARYLDREEAADSMSKIMSAPDRRNQITNLQKLVKGDVSAEEGVKRAFFDWMEIQTRGNNKGVGEHALFKKDRLQTFLNKYDEEAKTVLGEDHVNDLRNISADLDTLMKTSSMKATGASGTAQALRGMTPVTVSGILSRIWAVKRGVVSPGYVATDLGIRWYNNHLKKLRKGEADDILDEALLNPELAHVLATEVTNETKRIQARKMKNVITRLGARIGAQTEQSEDED